MSYANRIAPVMRSFLDEVVFVMIGYRIGMVVLANFLIIQAAPKARIKV